MRIPALLIVALTVGAYAADAPTTTTPPKPGANPEQREERRDRREDSKIHRAEKALEEAIADLKAAPHDFGGHRVEAIEACEKARQQLHEAVAFDEKHEGEKGEKGEKGEHPGHHGKGDKDDKGEKKGD